ncbi:metallophosphoesterase family protein [Elusimicrobiota bacterium]
MKKQNDLTVSRQEGFLAAFAIFVLFIGTFPNNLFSGEFSFAAMCDSRGSVNGVNEPVLSFVADHLIKKNTQAKFLVFPGDMVSGNDNDPLATKKELAYWKKVMDPVYKNTNMVWPRIWPVPGNHEMRHAKDADTFREAFPDVFMNGPKDEPGLYYSFDYKNSHFAIINTDHFDAGDPKDPKDDKRDWHYVKHLDWLKKDLESARERKVRHIFVFGHEPAFPITIGHLPSGMSNIGRGDKLKNPDLTYMKKRDEFWKVLSDNKVAAYVCGDDHAYGRQSVDGVYQIVTGGAGAPLYALNPCSKDEFKDIPKTWLTFKQAFSYYKILGYPHGKGDKCQASNDFVGGKYFGYVMLKVAEESIEVKVWGVEPDKDNSKRIKKGDGLRIVDSFVIQD